MCEIKRKEFFVSDGRTFYAVCQSSRIDLKITEKKCLKWVYSDHWILNLTMII
jgi:hypothetical protein